MAIRRTRVVAAALIIFLTASFARAATGGDLLGSSISADIQSLGPGGPINQLVSPQTVVDPGVEFSGTFTPNAYGASLPIEQNNSMGMNVDVFATSIRVIMLDGSLTGAHSNFGPTMRLNVTNIHFPGEYVSAINQTSGPAVYGYSITSPYSIAIDFDDFSARTMDFSLTPAPEPASLALVNVALSTAFLSRRRRNG